MIWTKKDLLGLEELSKEEILLVLDTAESFKEVSSREIKKVPALRGRTVVNLFYEPSTRTRVSFEVAAKRLSADVINIATETSSVRKGETLIDTGKNIQALKADIVVIRHNYSGAAAMLARNLEISVVNAGDGWHEHPTQALLDIFTLREKIGSIEGLNVSIVGDIAHSRVARSNIWGLTKLGAKVTVCAPKMLIPPGIEQMGAQVTHDIEDALKNADCVNVLRMQFERDEQNAFPKELEYFKNYGITAERIKKAKKNLIIMHPGPINRGIEMASEVADGPNSVILEQVTNGIAIRMSVLFLVAQANETIKNMSKILIKKGRIIDPASGIDEQLDLLVEDGKVAKIAKTINGNSAQVINAEGCIVMPGLMDMHVHLREPGREDKETIATATQAALKGGVTSLLAMPNTMPVPDCVDNLKFINQLVAKSALAHVFIAGAITQGRQGNEIVDIQQLHKEGAIAISDDGSSVDSPELMLKALELAKECNMRVICHCENTALSAKGVVNLGFTSTRMGLRGISQESEYTRIERDIQLAEKAGATVHIAHVSCAESVEIIAKAKKRGVKVTAETCPHYFALSEEAVLGYDTNMKINPPLRSTSDIQALKQGLSSGIIDAIASDHAPHTENEKEIEFERAEFGTIGLETMLSVAVTELIDTKVLQWPELVEKLSLAPSRILGINKGSLKIAQDADIVIIDPQAEWLVEKRALVSKSKNSCFLGRRLKGVVKYTLCQGKIAYQGAMLRQP